MIGEIPGFVTRKTWGKNAIIMEAMNQASCIERCTHLRNSAFASKDMLHQLIAADFGILPRVKSRCDYAILANSLADTLAFRVIHIV